MDYSETKALSKWRLDILLMPAESRRQVDDRPLRLPFSASVFVKCQTRYASILARAPCCIAEDEPNAGFCDKFRAVCMIALYMEFRSSRKKKTIEYHRGTYVADLLAAAAPPIRSPGRYTHLLNVFATAATIIDPDGCWCYNAIASRLAENASKMFDFSGSAL